MSFKHLISHPEILKAIAESGYETPTPIQEKVIPEILKGIDIRASSQTGSGKTAAFILPSLIRLNESNAKSGKGPRILILVPTRELAMQVASESAKYSKHLKHIKTVCIFGGAPYPPQNKALMRPYEILVATPGRLIDHFERGRIDFSRVETFILDEADRMLDMGFFEAVNQIAEVIPKMRQTLMFSATLKGNVLSLSKRLLNNPIEINVSINQSNTQNIEQRLYSVDNIQHKYRLLNHLLKDPKIEQVIVFTATKYHADQLAEKLSHEGHQSGVLHGGMKQSKRTRTMKQLREGQIKVLVATDVAARGIDIPTISDVINFDLPTNVEDYVHRIGRTGRAGASGVAHSFAAHKDMSTIKQIERFTGQKIVTHTIHGMEAQNKPGSTPFPSKKKFQRKFSYKKNRFKSGSKR